MDLALIYWALLAAVSLVAAGFAFFEYQAYLLRTDVKSVPGGLRFAAHLFTVETSRSEKMVKVTCRNGLHRILSLAGGDEQTHTGPLSLAMPAAGMRIDISQIGKRRAPHEPLIATGVSLVVFTGSENVAIATQGKNRGQRSILELDLIPDSVAQAFRHFSDGLDPWFNKLERDLVDDIAVKEKQAAVAALAQEIASEAIPSPQSPTAPLNPVEQEAKAKMQLAQWRQSAGFSGTQTDMRFDAFGAVDWLIDLNPDGRIILHSEKRHFQGTLKGAVVTMLADDLEVKVRDEFWQEGDRNLPTFRVLKGASRENLLTWYNRVIHATEIFVHDPDRHSPPSKTT